MTVTMAGGEVSSSLWARVDVAKFGSWLKTCLNWIVRPAGELITRGGTRYITTSKTTGHRIRLIPFVFNATNSYVLELGELYMRFIRNGETIKEEISVTDESIGTGDGSTKTFQLEDGGVDVTTPIFPLVITVSSAVISQEDHINYLASPNTISAGDWTKHASVTLSSGVMTWTPA